jgi:extradiol dioxygenase
MNANAGVGHVGIAELSYVGFGVSDMERWELLLNQVLGMASSRVLEDGTRAYRMDSYAQRVILHPSGEDDIVYAGWAASDAVAYAELAERIAAAGVKTTEAEPDELEARRVRSMFWFVTPDDLRMEIALAPTQAAEPFVPGRAVTGFEAEDRGVGHIVLRVDDRDANERFLTDVLGLRVTDYGTGRLVFLRCNRRHHSVAVGPRSFFKGDKHLLHLMVQASSLDDLGTAMDLCAEHGFGIPEALGKHTNDHMVSFYVRTPSGFDIEYGVGGRDVDEATWVVQSYARKDEWGHERRPV